MGLTELRSDPNRLRVTLSLYAAILLQGLMLASIGPALSALTDQTGTTLGQIGIVFTANAIGYIAGSLAAGNAYARAPGNQVLGVALIVMALFALLVPLSASLALLSVAYAGIGIAIGFIDVGCNTLIVWLFGPAVPPYMNALHLSFGVGAFLSPLLIDRFAVVGGNAAHAYWLVAVVLLPLAYALWRQPSPTPPETVGKTTGVSAVRRYGLLLGLIAAFFFLHVGAELAFGGWIFSYADALDIGPETTARVLNSLFWGGLVIGRLLAIPLSLRLSPTVMLWLDLLAALASLGLIGLVPDWPPSLWLGTIGFGVSIASIFASSMNYAEERMPISGLVTSVFLVGGSLGSMTLPWAVGRAFDARGPEWVLYLVGAAIVAAIAVFGVIRLYSTFRGLTASDAP